MTVRTAQTDIFAQRRHIPKSCRNRTRKRSSNVEDVKLFFRVGDVHKNAKVVVTYNGETLISKKRPRLAPGEMENVIIKSDMLKNFDENGIIEIQVEE